MRCSSVAGAHPTPWSRLPRDSMCLPGGAGAIGTPPRPGRGRSRRCQCCRRRPRSPCRRPRRSRAGMTSRCRRRRHRNSSRRRRRKLRTRRHRRSCHRPSSSRRSDLRRSERGRCSCRRRGNGRGNGRAQHGTRCRSTDTAGHTFCDIAFRACRPCHGTDARTLCGSRTCPGEKSTPCRPSIPA